MNVVLEASVLDVLTTSPPPKRRPSSVSAPPEPHATGASVVREALARLRACAAALGCRSSIPRGSRTGSLDGLIQPIVSDPSAYRRKRPEPRESTSPHIGSRQAQNLLQLPTS